jgi:uncharacterized membrane protein YfcA
MKYADKVRLFGLVFVVASTVLVALAAWAVVSALGEHVGSNLFVILLTANGFYLVREMVIELVDETIRNKYK